MSAFEILCVTMHQKDFSKITQMNIHSDVIFANQADTTAYDEYDFDGHKAKMITTQTRGVGINRNLTLMYASAEICLFADDDVTYVDNVEDIVLSEFKACPDADIIIFNFISDSSDRHSHIYKKTKKHGRFQRMPWGGVRIACRLNSIKKANLWYTTLFGGGCIFPSGEDSMFSIQAKRAGLKFYVSDKIIGSVSFATSSWYTGKDEKFYFGKGAYCKAVHPKTAYLWGIYYALRDSKKSELSFVQRIKAVKLGIRGYELGKSYNEIKNNMK